MLFLKQYFSIVEIDMWTKHSFQRLKRYIDYFNPHHPVFERLAQMPTIVSHYKIEQLKQELKLCENNQRLLLHCGDCAQPFEHVQRDILENKINHYKGVKKITESYHKKPVTIIGRIAGQYAKPRSSEFTMHNGKEIHNYKGDNVNGLHHEERQPDTKKLIQGYFNSVVTHNFINNNMNELYTSHEGLILPYQAALTTQINSLNYCLSAHMIWIGERTRQLDGAHVEFFRGLTNPIGVKISNKITDQQFLNLVRKLNPQNQQGKLIVIIRMGHTTLGSKLNHLIEIKLKHNLNFLFASDPMHGNTYEVKQSKLKTRQYDHILTQIHIFEKHMKKHHIPFGLSLQTTYEDVTQCIGGHYPLEQKHLQADKYTSKCDPRLNPEQLQKLIKDVKFI